jgi:site-specific recombinase XerD
MTAQSCSFFFKHILPSPYVVPHAIYPRKEFRLPDILTQEQISHVIQTVANLKHRAMIGLFYGTGIRLSELRFLKIKDISRAQMQIKVIAGKGKRDRFTP